MDQNNPQGTPGFLARHKIAIALLLVVVLLPILGGHNLWHSLAYNIPSILILLWIRHSYRQAKERREQRLQQQAKAKLQAKLQRDHKQEQQRQQREHHQQARTNLQTQQPKAQPKPVPKKRPMPKTTIHQDREEWLNQMQTAIAAEKARRQSGETE